MRRWSAISLGLLLGLCTSGAVQAQPADTIRLTVEQLFDRGTSCNLQLQADLLKERMAEERRKDARKQAYPDVEVELAGGVIGQPVVFLHGLTDPTYPETPDWSQDYGIVFRQPIYKSGKITLGIQKAELERQIAVLETAEDDASVKLGLLQQYLNLFCLYKQQELLSYKIRESERRLIDIRQMKREGLITNNDVLRSELQLTDDQLALTEVNDGILLVSQQLAILLALDEEAVIRPDEQFLDHVVPEVEDYERYVSAAYAANPAMQVLGKRIELSRNNIRYVRSDNLPSLYLEGGNTFARPITRTMVDLYNNAWRIGLTLNIPVSAFYKNRHRRAEAEQQLRLAINQEEQGRQQIRMQIRTAFLKHKEALERAARMKLSIEQARENYRIMENRYMNQLAILTDLLDANSVRLNVELQLTAARTRVIYTYYQLQKACGRL